MASTLQLPPELLLEIYKHCSLATLRNASQTCKQWQILLQPVLSQTPRSLARQRQQRQRTAVQLKASIRRLFLLLAMLLPLVLCCVLLLIMFWSAEITITFPLWLLATVILGIVLTVFVMNNMIGCTGIEMFWLGLVPFLLSCPLTALVVLGTSVSYTDSCHKTVMHSTVQQCATMNTNVDCYIPSALETHVSAQSITPFYDFNDKILFVAVVAAITDQPTVNSTTPLLLAHVCRKDLDSANVMHQITEVKMTCSQQFLTAVRNGKDGFILSHHTWQHQMEQYLLMNSALNLAVELNGTSLELSKMKFMDFRPADADEKICETEHIQMWSGAQYVIIISLIVVYWFSGYVDSSSRMTWQDVTILAVGHNGRAPNPQLSQGQQAVLQKFKDENT